MPWYCINTHAKKEKLARDQITNQGFEVFLPTFVEPSPKGEKIKPLFPSYLFVKFDPDTDIWFPIMHTIGVRRLFSVYSQSAKSTYGYVKPIPVATDLITTLQQTVLEPERTRLAVISPGTRVRIKTGMFENREGICTWSSGKRVALLLDAMSGKLEISFARNNLELV